MEKQTIIPEQIVPETTEIVKVLTFTVDLETKLIHVMMSDQSQKVIPISDVWSQMTTPQKNVVKGFFTEFAKIALDASTIIGDIAD